MTESAADCRPVPFALVFLFALIAIGAGIYGVPKALQIGAFDHRAVAGSAVFLGATMLVMCYLDAFRSRCLRGYVSIALVLLALACAIPFVGTGRSEWGSLQHAAINTLYLLGALFVILHFALHNMPSQWRAALTPRLTGMIGVAVMIGVALYRHFGPDVVAQADLGRLGAEGAGILVGGLLCAFLMRHRGRGAEG
jgi:hypothetical protein